LLAARGDPETAAALLVHNVNTPGNGYAELAEEPIAELRKELSADAMAEAEQQAAGFSFDDAVALARSVT